ncbi:MAG: cytochrome b/b6 domain-containing protein [Chromatiaceae bacterium]|jgi:thiosulfate reductase cytochrome b subunit
MEATIRVRRFTGVDRFTHLFLIVTFMILAFTGVARVLMETDWGRHLVWLMGGYDQVMAIHIVSGWAMTIGFVVHILWVLARVDWRHPLRSLFGPDSLVPKWRDFKEFGQRFLWFLGLAKAPRFERWTYLEKFDYWAVFWGVPLLFFTGLMLQYPIESSQLLPGWTLNVALVLHRAEAVLAVTYIVIIHLIFGHFRRSTFPLNEAMFSGSVPIGHLEEEKSDWVSRLRSEGRLAAMSVRAPILWFRALYFLFAYGVIALGVYLIVRAIPYSDYFHF